MKISFVVNPVFLKGGWSPWDTRVGGTEECVIEWSKRLSMRGHNVTVYHNGKHGTLEGVHYRERADYLLEANKGGVTVNVNYPDLAPLEPTLYWTTLDTQGGRDLSAFDAVACISQYARDRTGLDVSPVHILPPGYDPRAIYPVAKLPKTVLYASSPDRGLDGLLQVWPTVAAIHADAYLLITYGGHSDLPNTISLGEVSPAEMNDLYCTSDIWCHPATNGELYCMTGIKAQAAGCWPVYYPTMALAETVRFGTQSTPATLAQDLITALAGHPTPPTLTFPTWDSTTGQLEGLLEDL